MKPDSYDLKAKIGVIFQEVAVFDELNVDVYKRQELGIISPLANNNLAKQEIRDYSKQLGITTYNKPVSYTHL